MLQYEEYRQSLLNLKPELLNLRVALNVDAALAEADALEADTSREGFYNDRKTAQKTLQTIKQLRSKAESYSVLERDWNELSALCDMGIEEKDESLLPEVLTAFPAFTKALGAARMSTLLSGEYDNCNAIVTFHAGAGGTEAQDWAQMLYRMYDHWAQARGYDVKLVDWLDGDEAGIKSATLMISGDWAYGYLKSEHGVHRLIRVSPFDASGRRHTSFAALEVTPEITESSDIEIRPEDLRVDTYRSSGAGGQHVNKTESAIRITHIPTGLVVACQQERSQIQNRETAMSMLRSKLAEIMAREHYERIEDIKGTQMKNEWGSQIRTYTFMPYTLVKDHRTNYENGNVQAVMDGDLDGFINAYLVSAQLGA
ncbi:MAG: peptide chain release factor 2 [Oscillospiraceae bacterium]|jgi:peptide chain release factor 2|nr:peptide chain release factor 2 [Oscillospiraceae bacterium]